VHFLSYSFTLILTLFLTACGSGGGGGETDPGSTTLTGTLVDSPVSNIRYQTPSQQGFTNSLGEFSYLEGETITFHIGDIQFLEMNAKAIVTPIDLAGTADMNSARLQNILRLLQSLDSDDNPGNGIQILESAHQMAEALTLDFEADDFDSVVADYISDSVGDSRNLVDISSAVNHFTQSLQLLGLSDIDDDLIPDDYDAFPEDAGEYLDFDNDGVGNIADEDDDNDGVDDNIDLDPFDPDETTIIDDGETGTGTGPVFTVREAVLLDIENSGSLSESSIRIVSLNQNFLETLDNGDMPDYQVSRTPQGQFSLEFDETIEEQLNIVVQVTHSNDDIVYGPLASTYTGESISVGTRSHYLLSELFSRFTTEAQLDVMLPCPAIIVECSTQHRAKALQLEQYNKVLQDYDIDLSESENLQAALDILDTHADFKAHVKRAVDELVREEAPIAQGTPRALQITDGSIFSRLSNSRKYNSLWASLSLSNVRPEEAGSRVRFSASSSQVVSGDLDSNLMPIYPHYARTTFLFDTRYESTLFEFPYSRTSLTFEDGSLPSFDYFDYLYFISSYLSDTRLSTEGSILDFRSILQSKLSSDAQTETLVWDYSPMFSEVYDASEYELPYSLEATNVEEPDYGLSPTWLVSANYSEASSYNLIGENLPYSRGAIEELANLFSWELHGLETDNTFSRDNIVGKTYGVISYSAKLNSESDVITLYAETEKWQASEGVFLVTQPSEQFDAHTIKRGADNAVTITSPSTEISQGNRNYSTLETATGSNESENRGLVVLDEGARAPQGHATQDGRHLAFVLDTLSRGRGLTVATELASSIETPVFNSNKYYLQGNYMGLDTTTNSLVNLNESVLMIDGTGVACTASLSLSTLALDHSIDSNTLSDVSQESFESVSSTSCRVGNTSESGNGSELEIMFSGVKGENLTLKGFVTRSDISNAPGSLISLLWLQESRLGLVFATKTKALSSTFK